MPGFDWRSFLREFSAELLEDEEIRESLPEEVVASGWLGFPGATVAELEALEARLGVALPPSYRDFLAVSNGWWAAGWDSIRLWSTAEVGWLRDRDPQIVSTWTSVPYPPISDGAYSVHGDRRDTATIRPDDFRDMLAVSSRDWADEDQLWLDPRAVFEDGEWEAWHFSTESPGASRHRSFRELMENERRTGRFRRDD